ncbi:rod shape-determining protein MreC [Chromohalobacter japonicus]|uniref:rod shape-determining protein MreC n=1 Tax=Chromohalobacter japonicus TaxID=223900 RepID=UPI002481C0A1|nr:rod shape-determining protein MreC [Chromohalobacter japonicus]
MKPLFSHGPVPSYRMLLCAVAAFSLMFAEHRLPFMDDVRSQLTTVVAPVQWAVSWPSEGLSWAALVFSDQRALVDENQRLRQQLLTLSHRVQRMANLTAENVRLRELLNAAPRDEVPYITAELLSLDSDPFTQQMVIGRGRRDGVYVGQPVMDASGLIGQVIAVSAYTSRVLMVSDANNAVPVQVNRSGQRFIVQGSGDLNTLNVLNVPATADIKEGDLLTTSGLGGRFPEGYPVAEITQVDRDGQHSFASVEAQPLSQPERSRHFLLLFPSPAAAAVTGDVNIEAALHLMDGGAGKMPKELEEARP